MLKMAIVSLSDRFIFDTTAKWGWDWNEIDESDGRTPLDYVGSLILREQSLGSSLVPKYMRYYRLLRQNGGLHRFEIDGLDCDVTGPLKSKKCVNADATSNRYKMFIN